MPDASTEKLEQALETALDEAQRLAWPLLTYILMMAQLELLSRSDETSRSSELGN